MVRIYRFVVLSTEHLTAATRAILDGDPYTPQYPAYGGPFPSGYMLYAHDEDCDEPPMPADLWACCCFARTLHDVDYIRFDNEAEPIEGLPTYAE